MMGPDLLGSGAAAKDKYLRLWVHEILRVFYDRLVDRKDQSWFLDYMKETLKVCARVCVCPCACIPPLHLACSRVRGLCVCVCVRAALNR